MTSTSSPTHFIDGEGIKHPITMIEAHPFLRDFFVALATDTDTIVHFHRHKAFLTPLSKGDAEAPTQRQLLCTANGECADR